MTRDMTPAYEAAIEDQHLRPCLFFEGQFPSGTLRLWTGIDDVDWNGETWTGAGGLIGVSEIDETTEVVANGITVTLSGVPVENVALAINDAQQGLAGKIWIGLLDGNREVIADPVQAFVGRLDVPTITDGAETCTISVTYESRLIDLQRTREFRYTHEGQKLFDAADRGFEFVTSLQDKEITWGG